jgi:hypothetical protein
LKKCGKGIKRPIIRKCIDEGVHSSEKGIGKYNNKNK